jgi:hypothetical protein
LLVVSLNLLTQELSVSLCGDHIGQDGLALGNVTTSESGETNLNNSSVIQDLGGNIGLLNGFLHMRHEELISGLVVSSVHGVVVDVHEDRSCSEERCFGGVDVGGESVNEDGGRRNLAADGGDGGLETSTSGLSGLFKEPNEDVGSRVDVFKTTDDDSGDGIGGVLSLKEALSLDEGGVQRLSLLESVNVLDTSLVGVGVL